MNNGIRIRNIEPQEITIEGATTVAGITNVYVNGVDVTVGTKAYVIVPTKTSELTNDSGFITSYTETDPTVPAYVKAISLADINAWNDKQNLLVSGTNIKTINGNSILGSGNLEITNDYTAGYGINIDVDNVISNTITSYNDLTDLPTIPTTTGELINTSGFINNTVNDLTNYIRADLLEDILPSVSDSGTELYLQDTAPYTLHLELNPSEIGQLTTNGINYLPITLPATTTQNGVTLDYDSTTGWINVNGTASSNVSIIWQFPDVTMPATTYIQYENDFSSSTSQIGYMYNSTNVSALTFSGLNRIYDRSGELGNQTINQCYFYVASGTTINGKCRPMITQYNTQQTWEPYTGGIPAPNPDYPQDIHVISDENSITISNKNLFDKSKETANMIVNSVGTLSPNNDYNSSDFIQVKASTNVVLSTETSSAILEIVEYDKDKTLINRGVKTNSTFYNLTTSATTKYVRLSYQNNSTKPQFEYGSTATSYVEHEERNYPIELDDIELTKITTQWGDYENFIFKNSLNSPWYDSNYTVNSYVYGSRIFKYTLSSVDNWQVGGGGSYYANVNYNQLGSTKHFAISNYFQDESLVNDPSTDSWIMTQGNMIILHFNSSLNINSVDDLRTWLDNNEVIVYAIRGGLGDYNSYNQAIEYSLQNQWFNATNSIGYDGGTVITQENFDRPFDLSAKTIQKVTN